MSIAPAPPIVVVRAGWVTKWREGGPPLLPLNGLVLASTCFVITNIHMSRSLDPCVMSHDLILPISHVSAGHETSALCCTDACALTASSMRGFVT